jgi:hypothetical protein
MKLPAVILASLFIAGCAPVLTPEQVEQQWKASEVITSSPLSNGETVDVVPCNDPVAENHFIQHNLDSAHTTIQGSGRGS